MTERMTSADVAFLHRETATLPQHVGGLAIFAPRAGGFEYDRLVRLLDERISLAPRYRQRVRTVPGHLANPMWLDDPKFDITYHVRRSALPRPGTDEQLLEFCARIQSRLLDRSRPLWEMYLVEGLSDGRVAVVTKTHEAMVDERQGIDLMHVILDAAPEPRRTVEAIWMPAPEPSSLQLLRDALADAVHRPAVLGDAVRESARDLRSTVGKLGSFTNGATSLVRAAVRRAPQSPLRTVLSEQRRVAIARTRLDDYRRVRDKFGGAVNDVVLAVVAAALRGWLLARAEPLDPTTTVRALVPMSVLDLADPQAAGVADAIRRGSPHPALQRHGSGLDAVLAARVRPLLIDLPVGEADPVLRLAQLRYAMASHAASGQAVGAARIAALGGFAPPTLHALAARTAAELTRRMFSVVITNVPGPQLPLYASGARLTEMFPILPLGEGQAMSIALTSYDGGVFYGVNGDRDAAPDLASVAELIEESLAELVTAAQSEAVASTRRGPARPRTDGS
ncbi:MAG TPA: wax ester/triacylglycerol synthase family O-acyltransferase [Jatrophihabitans sp.]|jgi:WS/DGAT/MGAT family acyltransferase|nr:wax ester/triacylglycerol synthase family O-acyltransferase [Jatrophihabitans sp.]